MTLADKLANAKCALAEIKEAVESGDTEKAADMAAKIEEVKGIQTAIADAEEAEDMLKSLGTVSEKEEEHMEIKTLGEFAEKNLDLTAMAAGASKSASTGYGFKAATDVHMAPQIISYSDRVVDVAPALDVRALLGVEAISGNALTYYQLGATEGAADEVAQGATKPQFHVPYTPVTVPLTKVAGWFYETDELLSDAPFLRSAIDNRGMRVLREASEAFILGEITTGATSYAGSHTGADAIFDAAMLIQAATGFAADAVILNPADYADMRLDKDGTGQYYGGGYFFAPYGNGSMGAQPPLWGLRTVLSSGVTVGSAIVGAFSDGATLVTKANEGASIEVHRGDHDDAINNRVTVVVEERLAVAMRVPAAFEAVSLS